MFNNYNDGTFKKVTKTTAKKLFNAGKAIYLLPCKANINSIWFTPYRVKNTDNTENKNDFFNYLVNSFEYYNCTNETGKYRALKLKRL